MTSKADKEYLDRIQQLGCIVCKLAGVYTPAEIHHIVEGTRRQGHQSAIPLCVPHHRGGSDGRRDNFISRHPYKHRFEQEYGTEYELLAAVRRLLNEHRDQTRLHW